MSRNVVWGGKRDGFGGQGKGVQALLVVWAGMLLALVGAAQTTRSWPVHGLVLDANGNAVSGAAVRLEQTSGTLVREARSDKGGEFRFAGVEPGTYAVSALKGARKSRRVMVTVSEDNETRSVQLMLESGDGKSNASPGEMEFADQPNFTVAAVTDWTAAGGHGSDANLRTSEALNRETATLKPGSNGDVTGGMSEKEKTLQAALARTPGSFAANHELGVFYLQAGKAAEAVPLLRAAYTVDPKNAENEFELAEALKEIGELGQAQGHVKDLMARRETGDLHRLAGEIDEKMNDPLAAVHEMEEAVQWDPSEENYFAWGSELLLHRAVLQARDVFAAGARKFTQSERMLTALGAALFAGALYDDAARRLCEASDLDPKDAEPYLFMGKIEKAAPDPLPCVEEKLARFVEMRPEDALANYFYAIALWKHEGQPARERVMSMLTKAVTVDPKCGDAYLQLGVMEAGRQEYPHAIGYYEKAIAANPQMTEAHYRLAVAYDRAGEKDKAAMEFAVHDQLEKEQAAEVERQRKEVKQFLVVSGKEAGKK
jgi:tetratricopeptide (TPR) repeat protein